MKKRQTSGNDLPLDEETLKKRREKRNYLIVTLLNTVAIYGLYVILITAMPQHSVVTASVYMIALAALSFGYVFYNRGFSRKNVTIEMLPLEWTEEEKRDFIEDGERRLKRSKWCLTLLIPLIFTFFMELFIFYIYDPHLAPILGDLF